MNPTLVYAIVIGGLLALFICRHGFLVIERTMRSAQVRNWIFHHLKAALIHRKGLVPRLSRLYAGLEILYWGGTAICNVVGVQSLPEATARAGALTAFNMIPLLFGDRLGFAADLLNVSHKTYQQWHKTVGLMTTVQMSLHLGLQAVGQKLDLGDTDHKIALIATVSLAAIALLSFPFPRNYFYELFLLFHHLLSVLLLYSLWRYFTHLKTNQVYLIIAISGYGTLALARLVRLLWRSYSYGKGVCTAQVSNCEGALMVTIELKRPMKIGSGLAGQYVFITASGLSALSRLQRHPFSIAWWSENLPGHTNELSLLIQPRRGFTRQLLQHSLSHEDLKVWVDGPYGRHLTTDRFRTVILFASGMGIASHLSLIKEIIAQYYARCTSVTRLVLVWQVQHEDQLVWNKPWMDQILEQDAEFKIFSSLLYIADARRAPDPEKTSTSISKTFGILKQLEISQLIGGALQNLNGELLVAVSAPGTFRDMVQSSCREFNDNRLEYTELEYQPPGASNWRPWSHFISRDEVSPTD